MQRLTSILPALALLAAGCVLPADEPQPVDVLRFPSDLALSADGQVLYVVDSNFDLAFDTGVLHAVDVAAMQALADAAPVDSVARLDVPWVGEGGVQIGSFGGRPAVARRSDGSERVFIPIRGGGAELDAEGTEGGEVAVVERGPQGLACLGGALPDCRGSQVVLATPAGETMSDPYATAILGDSVWVAALASQEVTVQEGFAGFHLARMSVEAPDEVEVDVQGNLRTRAMVPVPGRDELALAGSFRVSTGGGTITVGVVRAFDPATLGSLSGDETSEGQLSVQAVLGANEVQDLAFSPDGRDLWVVTRSPSAVSRFEWDGVSTFEEATHVGTVLLPDGATRLAVLDDGVHRVLAVTSVSAGTLSFVDADRMRLVGILDGTTCADPSQSCPVGARGAAVRVPEADPGERPVGLVSLPAESGGRLVVGGFEQGRLSIVDIPDLARPWEARVRAVFQSPEGQ